MKKIKNKRLKIFLPIIAVIVLIGLLVSLFYLSNGFIASKWHTGQEENPLPEKMVPVGDNEEIEGGVHVATGLVAGEGLNMVIANCTGCHSSQLITQNRATREGWIRVIRWMQETQNLWELGENEEVIVSYLTKYYAPEGKGRRAPLTDIEWYELKE